ncbi:YitT family protein [Fundicoccus culcitae]|uniref:YitT family protein n=1 Tax=Fundicoccus culcitae TaxID=2969821 RepID=A0ABY5P6D3_9LACT|nr:YitT family protein [Fundicoccus culcitae]UUX34109.1 YitT family protein [Fundicoccus culcitae]
MINQYLSNNPKANFVFQLIIALFSATCFGVALNMFYIPGNVYSSGVTGLAQLLAYFTQQTPFGHILNTANLYFLLNVPLLILSWLKLGRHFTLMTILVVILTTIMTNVIPTVGVSQEPLLNAIIGGVISGIGAGTVIKYGMSGGGLDILTIYLSRVTSMNVGSLTFLINLIVIFGSGILFNWEVALFSLIAIYVSGRMIDTIHTNEQRLTVFIVTNNTTEMLRNIHQRLVRGVTILDGRGGYTGENRDVLMVVINRYELHSLQLIIAETDPKAFVNIIQSTKVIGHYLNKTQQLEMREEVRLREQMIV